MPEKYGLSIELHDFSQAQFETYQQAVIKASRQAYTDFGNGTGVTASALVRGETVRAALRNKILTGVTLDEVAAQKPYVVEWLADEIRAHIVKITTAPTDPN